MTSILARGPKDIRITSYGDDRSGTVFCSFTLTSPQEMDAVIEMLEILRPTLMRKMVAADIMPEPAPPPFAEALAKFLG